MDSCQSLKLRRYTPSCDRGFTLVELLVANLLGVIVVGMTISVVLQNRDLYQHDITRTRLNQNLRSALDVIGINAREAGENLPAGFPAVEVIDGPPDELILRRNLIDEVLKLCQPITAGSGPGPAYFSAVGSEPGCSYADQTANYDAWRQERLDRGGVVSAYIYDPVEPGWRDL